MDLYVELYKKIAGFIETLAECRNASIGCEAEKRSLHNVQIIYNFSGHGQEPYWHYLHVPLQLSHEDFVSSVNRVHVGCDDKRKDSRCSTHSRYHMEYWYSNTVWTGEKDWKLVKGKCLEQ